jgi:hypothetical protein
MQSTLMAQALIWMVMAAVVGTLAIYRKYVSRAEVDVLHLRETESVEIPRQEAMAHRLDSIDRWGKVLTIALFVYGVAIACGFGYFAWQSTNQPIS